MKSRKAKGRPQPHNDRGEWRPFYEVLWDDPDFQKLDPESRWVWATLKGRAGACGIRLIPALEHVLARWTGYPLETVSKALRNLVHAEKIVLEGDVAWVRRGIDFEPTLFVNNALHRQFVANTLNALPRMEIVRRYAEENAHWLVDTTYTLSKPFLNPTPTPTPTPSSGTTPRTEDSVPFASLVNRMAREPDRWAVVEFLEGLPAPQKPEPWAKFLGDLLDGLDLPGGRPATPEQVAATCRDFRTKQPHEFTPKFFRTCLAAFVRDSQRGTKPPGETATERTLRAAEAFVRNPPPPEAA